MAKTIPVWVSGVMVFHSEPNGHVTYAMEYSSGSLCDICFCVWHYHILEVVMNATYVK